MLDAVSVATNDAFVNSGTVLAQAPIPGCRPRDLEGLGSWVGALLSVRSLDYGRRECEYAFAGGMLWRLPFTGRKFGAMPERVETKEEGTDEK